MTAKIAIFWRRQFISVSYFRTRIQTHDRLKIRTHLSRRATQPPTIVSVCFRNDRVLFEFHSNFRRLPLFVQKICISLRIRFLTAAKVKKSEGWLRMGHFLLHELFLLLFSPWVVPLMVRRSLNGSVYRLIKIQVFLASRICACVNVCVSVSASIRMGACKCNCVWVHVCLSVWMGGFWMSMYKCVCVRVFVFVCVCVDVSAWV